MAASGDEISLPWTPYASHTMVGMVSITFFASAALVFLGSASFFIAA